MYIIEDDLIGVDIRALQRAHLEDAYKNSPPDSVYALDIDALQKPDITFWTVWENGTLLGCGALKELNKTHGEIKSMRTVTEHLGKGVGTFILKHLIKDAKRRGYHRLNLETGSNAAYAPARTLYAKFGFMPCGPFEEYKANTFSFFMSLSLQNY